MSGRRAVWLAEDERKWDHITVHQRVLQHPDLSIYERGVYCVLAWHANAETGESHPGQPTIGKEAGCSERRVRTAIGVLQATRLIDIIHEPGKPIIYRLLSPPKEPIRLKTTGNTTPAGGAALGNEPRQEVPHSDPDTPAGGADVPRQEVPHNKKESLNEEEALKESTSAIANSKTPKPKPAPKTKAPPHPETSALVAYFVEVADTPTLKASTARIGQDIKKALGAGSAPAHIREAIERVVREGNPGRFVPLLNGVERHHRNHDPAPKDTPIARMVLALSANDDKRRDDGGQTLGEIAAELGYQAGGER